MREGTIINDDEDAACHASTAASPIKVYPSIAGALSMMLLGPETWWPGLDCPQHKGDQATEKPVAVVTSTPRGAFSFMDSGELHRAKMEQDCVKCITKVCGDGHSLKSIISLYIYLCDGRASEGLSCALKRRV